MARLQNHHGTRLLITAGGAQITHACGQTTKATTERLSCPSLHHVYGRSVYAFVLITTKSTNRISSIPHKTRSCSSMNRRSYTTNLLKAWGIEQSIESIHDDAASKSQHDSVLENDSPKSSKCFEVSEGRPEQALVRRSDETSTSAPYDNEGRNAPHHALRTPMQARFLPPGPPPNRPLPALPDRRRDSKIPTVFLMASEREA